MPDQILQKGNQAPDFELFSSSGQLCRLSDLKGKNVIIAFYPADWSPVCSDQLAIYNEALPFFKRYNAEIIGIAVDSKWCHAAFVKDRHFHFPLLADFEPKGKVSRLYGAYNESEGYSKRALFVIDTEGVIQWSYLSPDDINPGADGILDALEEMSRRTAVQHSST
jgi:peroxiredoxin